MSASAEKQLLTQRKARARLDRRRQILLAEMELVLDTIEHVIAESPHGLKSDDPLFTIYEALTATVDGLRRRQEPAQTENAR